MMKKILVIVMALVMFVSTANALTADIRYVITENNIIIEDRSCFACTTGHEIAKYINNEYMFYDMYTYLLKSNGYTIICGYANEDQLMFKFTTESVNQTCTMFIKNFTW